MISNLILAGATSLAGFSYYLFAKERKIATLFDETVRMENYDLDFVRDLSELPNDKDIVISANVLPLKEDKKSISQLDQDVIYSELVSVKKQVEESDTDFVYYSKKSSIIDFRVGESANVSKQMAITYKPSECLLYNLHRLQFGMDPSPYSSQLSLVQKLQFKLSKQYSLTEFSIIPNSSFTFIGRVVKSSQPSSNSPQYEFVPKVIMSTGKDSLLQHLDRYLVSIHERGKKSLAIGAGIMIFHGLITKVIFAAPKSTALPE